MKETSIYMERDFIKETYKLIKETYKETYERDLYIREETS